MLDEQLQHDNDVDNHDKPWTFLLNMNKSNSRNKYDNSQLWHSEVAAKTRMT